MSAAKKPAGTKKPSTAKKVAGASTTQGHDAAFRVLCGMFAELLPKLQVLKDNEKEYTLHTQVVSPFKQHKGAPMFFGSVRNGKAYASFHLFPLYMNEKLKAAIEAGIAKAYAGSDLLQLQGDARSCAAG